jgi:hypothetical protein
MEEKETGVRRNRGRQRAGFFICAIGDIGG